MVSLYPDAKFILSLRHDEQAWLKSMRCHVGRGKWIGYKYFYGADEVDGNEATALASYRNHTAAVREFFQSQPQRLLELNIDDGDANWGIPCAFVGCRNGLVPQVGFPRSSAAASWGDDRWAAIFVRAWHTIPARTEELCVFWA